MISLSDLEKAVSPDVLAGLADDDTDGTADSAVITAAIEAAEAHVRHAAGLAADAELSGVLRDAAITLAVERLYERRREILPGPWSERAARARALLASIGGGEAAAPAPAADAPSRVAFTPQDRGRTTSRSTLDRL